MRELRRQKSALLLVLAVLFSIVRAAQVVTVVPATNVWTITPESAARYGYEVELLPRALSVLRIEFPTSINDGYQYGYTNVQMTGADGNTILLRVQAYDVAGEPERQFITLSGSEEWLACLSIASSFHKPDPTRPFTMDTGSYWYVQIDAASFLEDASCANGNVQD